MKMKLFAVSVIIAGLVAALSLQVWAHCDTMDGPVVTAAKLALEKGEVTPVLKWIKAENEREIRTAFAKTLAVRKQSAEAKELADMYFFETLVRVHRAGEGEPYTGLKPVGTEVEPGIAAADKAIESGKVDGLVKELTETVAASIRQRHQRVMETKKHADESVDAGREYVAAYVEYIHHVERLHEMVAAKPGAHAAEAKLHEHTK
jgi:hypothetical protein